MSPYVRYCEIMNYRGQDLDIISNSVDEGERRELFFKEHINKKYGIKLVKKDKYKHYDFKLDGNKNICLELKTYNYKTDDLKNCFVGCDKIHYYHYRQTFNDDLRFFIVFGFYHLDNDRQYIKYLFTEVDTTKIKLLDKTTYLNKKHYLFCVADMKPLKELVSIIQQR